MQQEKVPDVTIAWVDAAIGYGVWANDDIPPFTFVGEYTGSLRRPYLFKDLSNYYCFNYYITMSYWERNIRQPYLIDAQRSGNFTRYINHSYKPNLETASIYYQGMLHIVFYAKELIRKGAQLCYDYGPIYWEKRAAPLPLPNNIGLFF
ncbi:MAG TPA: SET domain-containing protein-lysine N-methyltransferase [Rhabdochlamydiaceae bacterium]